MAKCAFCDGVEKLQRSHVVPEFFYEYDDRHRLLAVDGSGKKPRLEQKGTRYLLLCFACEQYFNDRFDKPAHRIWFDKRPLRAPLAADIVTLDELDYGRFKLFHLSVLWRALAAAYRSEMTEMAGHATRLREMLRTLDPGKPTEYPIVAQVIRRPGSLEPATGVVMLPQPSTIREVAVYSSVFGGCHWLYALTLHGLPTEIQEWALNSSGRMIALVRTTREIEEVDQLLAMYETNAAKQGWVYPFRRKGAG